MVGNADIVGLTEPSALRFKVKLTGAQEPSFCCTRCGTSDVVACNMPVGSAYTNLVGDSSPATRTLPLQNRAATIAATSSGLDPGHVLFTAVFATAESGKEITVSNDATSEMVNVDATVSRHRQRLDVKPSRLAAVSKDSVGNGIPLLARVRRVTARRTPSTDQTTGETER